AEPGSAGFSGRPDGPKLKTALRGAWPPRARVSNAGFPRRQGPSHTELCLEGTIDLGSCLTAEGLVPTCAAMGAIEGRSGRRDRQRWGARGGLETAGAGSSMNRWVPRCGRAIHVPPTITLDLASSRWSSRGLRGTPVPAQGARLSAIRLVATAHALGSGLGSDGVSPKDPRDIPISRGPVNPIDGPRPRSFSRLGEAT